MNFLKFLDTLSDKDLLNEKSSRRDSFDMFKTLGKGAALASIPFGLAAISTKTKAATKSMAYAAEMADEMDVLNFALTLEYLERSFYQQGLDAAGLIPSSDQAVFAKISQHEDAHVDFLVTALGSNAVAEPTFDFTGAPGGLNLDPFGDYPTFMALAQGFEDTGVRAYKGQAGALANDNALLEYALQIHSVEARHASQVRRMRGEKGWITQSNNTLPTEFAAIYGGSTPESNTTQGGVNLSGMFGQFGGDAAVTEAFDEPLTMNEVLTIASIFIVS
ncbi:ferritin-like domain-containing protein [Subsaxibacter sp. CAU 1640]|uniref:ferritin-like domain-containing protein n=1 Tax=Subsaxibacter sp. CAU 1640 TaxID=2933271 RepID=UPI0020055BF1|nr:ferritin-like domain-containing protein [Subsaxibacter sp. CAU 1640]MCK7591182.1 ferritin-like domain-containing protein [Subsaxibacter sp. CAU 1640]